MKKTPIFTVLATLATLAALTFLITSSSLAQAGGENSYDELLRRLEAIERNQAVGHGAATGKAPLHEGSATFDDPAVGWFVNYESVILQPYFTRNTAAIVTIEDGTPEEFNGEFPADYEYSPRIEFGSAPPNDGWGWRVRYWHYEHNANTDVFGGEDGEVAVTLGETVEETINSDDGDVGISAERELGLCVWDFEGATRSDIGRMTIVRGGGLRYVDLNHSGFWVDIDLPTNDSPDAAFLSNEFSGAGPTLFFEASRPFPGRIGRDLSLYAKTRGSLLVGRQDYEATQRGSDDYAVTNDQALVPVAELQLGLSYARDVPWGLFELSVGWESQAWFNVGAVSSFETGEGLAGDPSSLRTEDMLLSGVTVGVKLTF